MVVLGFLCGCCLSEEVSKIKTQGWSSAISQIIDYLSEHYQMRFNLISMGNVSCCGNLIGGIVASSKFPVELRHFSQVNFSLVDHDESNIVLYSDPLVEKQKFLYKTKLVTFRQKTTIFFDLTYDDEHFVEALKKPFKHRLKPHDIYYLASSSGQNNGSMWILNNEIYISDICKTSFRSINFFNSSIRKWDSNRFINKYNKFNKCGVPYEIEFGGLYSSQFYYIHNKIFTYIINIIRTFAEKHEIVLMRQDKGFGELRHAENVLLNKTGQLISNITVLAAKEVIRFSKLEDRT